MAPTINKIRKNEERDEIDAVELKDRLRGANRDNSNNFRSTSFNANMSMV